METKYNKNLITVQEFKITLPKDQHLNIGDSISFKNEKWIVKKIKKQTIYKNSIRWYIETDKN